MTVSDVAFDAAITSPRWRLREAYLVQLDKTKVATNLLRRLQRLGYDVKIAEMNKIA